MPDNRTNPSVVDLEISKWKFRPTLKISPASSRCRPSKDTLEKVEAVLDRVPISRVSDLGPLDRQRIPVFSAVTPLARDLTTHLGKGTDAASARVSALMEAVERCSAETPPQGAVRQASFAQLAQQPDASPIDPRCFDLPDDSAYSPEHSFSWLTSFDIVAKKPVFLPVDLAINPATEGILREVDTNGLAAGNCLLEAVVHGLCEVIERDAQSQHEFSILFTEPGDPIPDAAAIDLSSLPVAAAEWVTKASAADLEMLIFDLTNDLGVPIFQTVLIDSAYPTLRGVRVHFFPGYGCSPNAELALLRSITESFQSRLALIQGARDSFSFSPADRRAVARGLRLRSLFPLRYRPFEDAAGFVSTDLLEDLHFLLRRLGSAGFDQVVVSDLTKPDLGIPVVRVRVPGLSCFELNRRRVGWRCLRYLL